MKMKVIIAVILLTVVSIASTGIGTAEVTNIDTGETFTIIQNAIDDNNTIDGHTLIIGSGRYTGNICISKSLTLRAETKGEVKVKAKHSTTAVIRTDTDNVTISGLYINGHSQSLYSNTQKFDAIGIMVWGNSNCRIDNCTFTGTSEGINLGYADNITIRDNLLSYSYRNGIFLQNASNCIIETTNVTGCKSAGIRIVRGINNLFQKNHIKINRQNGIIAWGTKNTTFRHNFISENWINGFGIYNSTGTTITANEITQNRGNGILVNAGSCRITNNIIIGNRAHAIFTTNTTNSLIMSNSCHANGNNTCE